MNSMANYDANRRDSRALSRRAWLQGVGVSMALPWMESMAVWGQETARGQPSSEAPVRLAILFAGNGFHAYDFHQAVGPVLPGEPRINGQPGGRAGDP
jgi:hypothetical protein